jgi:hypothetical protein
MPTRPRRLLARVAALASLVLAVTLVLAIARPREARADDTIKHPGDHPNYSFEIEPHAVFGWDGVFASSGFGVGVRAAIPLVQNGFVPTINNSVAIGFGADLVRYSQCFFTNDCGAWYLYFPVVMQWNFFVAQKWSVFGEPGLYIYKGFVDVCSDIDKRFGCQNPSDFGLRPAIFLGGRFHVNEHLTVTMRLGYPTFSVGVSFF